MIEKQVSFERQFRTLTAASLSAFTLFISFYSLYRLLFSLKKNVPPNPLKCYKPNSLSCILLTLENKSFCFVSKCWSTHTFLKPNFFSAKQVKKSNAWSLPPRAWMFVPCECCVLSGRDLCVGLITRPEEPYGCLSVVSVVCCQVEVSATGWSLVQRSPMDVCLLWVLCVVR